MERDIAQDAKKLRDAAEVMKIWFGGLGGPIAVLEDKARQLENLAAEAKA